LALDGEKTRLILQNKDNIKTIEEINIINKNYIRLIKGAGVETKKFLPSQIPLKSTIVILPGRMLWDKGVGEFVRVAKRIKARNIMARFILVGDIDLDNPESIKQIQIDKWVKSGTIEHWGRRDDMKKVYKDSSIVCLPSYNEGLPKVLLEAGSCSRPTVAFDVPGCREVIKNKVNGFLVELKNEHVLETTLVRLINNKKLCEEMGKNGRQIVERHFASNIINAQTFNIWNELN
jgi:glycosyltransferase involved in cell wall biosynthesis